MQGFHQKRMVTHCRINFMARWCLFQCVYSCLRMSIRFFLVKYVSGR